MGESLAGLRASLSSLAGQISAKRRERQEYLKKAGEIKRVYDRMFQDKKTIQSYRKTVNSFYKKSYNDFKGNIFKNTYKPEIKNLLDSYDLVIKNIDFNLDALNNAKLVYENKASGCLGPLGMLESSYNSVLTKIQNWTN